MRSHAARALRTLPQVKAAWETGRTTAAHVQRLARVRGVAKADEHFDNLEATWLKLCEEQDTKVLSNALAGFMDRLDNSRPAEESNTADAIERRMLAGSVCMGVGLMEAHWDLADYQTVMNAIDHELELGHVEGDGPDHGPTTPQTLHASICDKYNQNTDPDGENPPVLNTVIDVRTLAGIEAGLCETDRGLPLCVETVRRSAATQDRPDPRGRTRRDPQPGHRGDFQPGQRRHALPDRGCCFPGCSRSVQHATHHMDPWDDGGHTDLDKGCLLC